MASRLRDLRTRDTPALLLPRGMPSTIASPVSTPAPTTTCEAILILELLARALMRRADAARGQPRTTGDARPGARTVTRGSPSC